MPYCWVSTNDRKTGSSDTCMCDATALVMTLSVVMRITSSVTWPFVGSISGCLFWKGRSACPIQLPTQRILSWYIRGSRCRIGLTFFIGPLLKLHFSLSWFDLMPWRYTSSCWKVSFWVAFIISISTGLCSSMLTGSRFAAPFCPCGVLLTVLSWSPLPFLSLLCKWRQSATALPAWCQSEKFWRRSRRPANGFVKMAKEVMFLSWGFHKKSGPLHHLGLFTTSSALKAQEASSAGLCFVSTLLHWFGSEYSWMVWTLFAT